MQINRIREQLAGENSNPVISIELTSDEIEQAFGIREREYLLEDVENAVQEAYENEQISEETYQKVQGNKEILTAIAERYEKTCSCNIAHNATMEDAVKYVTGGMQGC